MWSQERMQTELRSKLDGARAEIAVLQAAALVSAESLREARGAAESARADAQELSRREAATSARLTTQGDAASAERARCEPS